MKKYQTYDYRIQLMRIFACIMVIGCHASIYPIFNDSYSALTLFVNNFYDDGVAIFFMIMGFFIGISEADNRPIRKTMGKTFLRILIPVFISMALISLFSRWIAGDTNFLTCILNPQIDYKMLVKSFGGLDWSLDPAFGHLWYIATYLQLIISMPLIKLLTIDHPYAKKAIKWILTINILGVIAQDIAAAFVEQLYFINEFFILGTPFTYLLMGYLIYSHRDLISQNKHLSGIISVTGMLVINVIRFALMHSLLKKGGNYRHFNMWTTCFALVFATCFVVFFLSFEPKKNENPLIGYIGFLGSATFPIYLIHVSVITFLSNRDFPKMLYNTPLNAAAPPISILLYTLTYPTIVFIISFLLCAFPTFIGDVLRTKKRSLSFHPEL